MVNTRLMLLAAALNGCVDLGIEQERFACRSGGPCPSGEEAQDGSAAPDAEAIVEQDAAENGEQDAAENGAPDAGAIDGGALCSTGPSGVWAQLSPTGAIPRAGHSVVVDTRRNRALIYGGAGTEARLFALTVSGTPAFEPLDVNSPPPARREQALVYAEGPDGIIIFGGIGVNGATLGDAWSLLFDDPQWIPQESLRTPRYSAAGAMLESVVDYIALFNGCGDQGPFDDDHQFDVILALVGLLATPAPRPSARCDQSATLVPGWGTAIFGGRNSGALGDLWRLVEDFPNRTWTRISIGGPPRYGHSTVFDPAHRRLLVFGGFDDSDDLSGELWAYSIDGSCWSRLEPSGPSPSPRAQHAAFMLDGKMYLVGGDDGSARDDLWSLSF